VDDPTRKTLTAVDKILAEIKACNETIFQYEAEIARIADLKDRCAYRKLALEFALEAIRNEPRPR
jgi:hypothetical protein